MATYGNERIELSTKLKEFLDPYIAHPRCIKSIFVLTESKWELNNIKTPIFVNFKINFSHAWRSINPCFKVQFTYIFTCHWMYKICHTCLSGVQWCDFCAEIWPYPDSLLMMPSLCTSPGFGRFCDPAVWFFPRFPHSSLVPPSPTHPHWGQDSRNCRDQGQRSRMLWIHWTRATLTSGESREAPSILVWWLLQWLGAV